MNEELTGVLIALADKLGTTVENLWGVLIAQAQISAFKSLFYLVVTTIVFLVVFLITKKQIKKCEENSYAYDEWKMATLIVGLSFAVILLLVLFRTGSNMIDGFMNPEYWALQHLLENT